MTSFWNAPPDDHFARSSALWGAPADGQQYWGRGSPTPPRARTRLLPCDELPQQVQLRSVPGQPRPSSYKVHQQSGALDASYSGHGGSYRGSYGSGYGAVGLFDSCGVWEQAKAPIEPLPPVAKVPLGADAQVRCDKCDQAHPTERCPYFKGARDEHADAWQSYSGSASSRASRPVRTSSAPRFLPRHAYAVSRMPGDGACLFHSIAFGLNAMGIRSEDGYSVRQRVARFIAENPDFEITGTPLRSWVDWDSGMTVDSYASRLSRGGLWGGAIEMAACAQIFSSDVIVYEEDYYGSGIHRISDFLSELAQGRSPRGTIAVLYSGRSHYDALQLQSDVGGAGVPRRGYDGNFPSGSRASGEALSHHCGAEDDDFLTTLCTLM